MVHLKKQLHEQFLWGLPDYPSSGSKSLECAYIMHKGNMREGNGPSLHPSLCKTRCYSLCKISVKKKIHKLISIHRMLSAFIGMKGVKNELIGYKNDCLLNLILKYMKMRLKTIPSYFFIIQNLLPVVLIM